MLKLKSLITPAALLAAFTLIAAPSFAQEKNHGHERPAGQQSSGQRAQPRSESPRPQAGAAPSVAPTQQRAQQAPRAQAPQVQQPRTQAPQAQAPQAQAPQAQQPRADNRRFENRNDGRNDNRHNDVVGRAVPRPQVVVPRGNYAPHYDGRYSNRYYTPRSYYRPYQFRPRFSIGFGIYAGYPVPYSYSYPYPIDVYGYGAPSGPVMISPGASAYGGIALEITPSDADVYVDGQYAGRVEDFDGTTQPLTLTSGTHRIDLSAPGYETMTVDVGIQPGQVIPYRGDLRRY